MTKEERQAMNDNFNRIEFLGQELNPSQGRKAEVIASQEVNQQLNLICCLCERNRPIFAGDEYIKRLPEVGVNKFLRVL